MKSRLILILIISSCNTINIYGQNKVWQKVQVRKAFETQTDDDDKPAILSLALPNNKPNSFLINAGLGYEINTITKLDTLRNRAFRNTINAFFVFNKNTEIDKEQHNHKLGVTIYPIFFINTEQTTAIFGGNTIEYLNDRIDTIHSMLFTSYWHPLMKKPGSVILGGYRQQMQSLAYYFLPQLGLEYQNDFKANKDQQQGYALRGYFSLGASFLLKKRTYLDGNLLEKNRWTKGLELKVAYDGRYSFLKSIEDSESYIPFFRTELIYYLTRDNKFSIGLSYNNGANPIEGIAKQEFLLLAIRIMK